MPRTALRRAATAAFAFVLVLTPASLLAQKDFRALQSPVKDQGQRSTCTAFALVAALETFPGVPTRLSEQYLYAFMKKTQYDAMPDPVLDRLSSFFLKEPGVSAGDRLSRYIELFKRYGIPHEEYLPYQGGALTYDTRTLPIFKFLFEGQVTQDQLERVGQYGKYGLAANDRVDALIGDQARDVDAIKRWIDTSGVIAVPVSYTIHIPTWVQYTPGRGPSPRRLTLQDSVQGTGANAVLRYPASEYGGHAVTIVGYTNDAFIIKNSWGTSWGEAGYGYVSFEFHRVFAKEALRIGQVRYRGPKPSPQDFFVGLSEDKLRLKAQPLDRNGQKILVMSTYSMDLQDPYIDRVVYRLRRNGQTTACPGSQQGPADLSFRCDAGLVPAPSPSETFDVDVDYTVVVRDSSGGTRNSERTVTNHYRNVRFAMADYRPVTLRESAGARR